MTVRINRCGGRMMNLNEKTKAEQLFIVMLMFVVLLGIFCITGCGGGKSCETPKCGSEDYYGGTARGCSIPGCGGCLTSGKGCNTSCWPQSYKFVAASSSEKNEETGEKDEFRVLFLDTRYYAKQGCLGCGQIEKICYYGCVKLKDSSDDSNNANGCFYGSSDSGEKMIGCVNGCAGCFPSEGMGDDTMKYLEDLTGVD